MREILFRGKRVDNGEWVEGFLVKKIDPLLGVESWFILVQKYDRSCIDNKPTILESLMTWYKVIPETIGQYTGKTLCDTKVFEGDIVEWYEEYVDSWGYTQTANGYSVVVWDDEKFCWGFDTDGHIQSFNNWDWYGCFVVGNIHDNPELLKEGAE